MARLRTTVAVLLLGLCLMAVVDAQGKKKGKDKSGKRRVGAIVKDLEQNVSALWREVEMLSQPVHVHVHGDGHLMGMHDHDHHDDHDHDHHDHDHDRDCDEEDAAGQEGDSPAQPGQIMADQHVPMRRPGKKAKHGHKKPKRGHKDHKHGHRDHKHGHGDHEHDHGDKHDNGDVHDHGDKHDPGNMHDHGDTHEHGQDGHKGKNCMHKGDMMHEHHDHHDEGMPVDSHGTHVHIHLHTDAVGHMKHLDAPPEPPQEYRYARCDVVGNSALPLLDRQNIQGTIHFRQMPNQHLELNINLRGFVIDDKVSESHRYLRGMHGHVYGDMSDGCNRQGGHYNPEGVHHGGPHAHMRHPGDFGNLILSKDGTVMTEFNDTQCSLFGPHSLLGRGIVIHAGADDLGLMADPGSKKSGNAGARVACCSVVASPEPAGIWSQ